MMLQAADVLLTQPISLDVQNKPLYIILKEIENDYQAIRFSYSPDMVDIQVVKSIRVKDKPLNHVLDILFANTQIEYLEMNKNIALRIKTQTDKEVLTADESLSIEQSNAVDSQEIISSKTPSSNADDFVVHGVVVDKRGESLPGTTVQIKNTFTGVSTDINGQFVIDARHAGAVLIFKFIGMDELEVPVNGKHTLNVVMKSAETDLDELVVVAYGTKRKSDVIGSMSTISTKDISYAVPTTIDKMLEGVAPGLMVTSTSSEPGAKTEVRIRGESSIDGVNTPLYIVDGIPFTTEIEMEIYDGFSFNPLASINPDDIESITVLKDAAATSIYGANASNGVILITTKRGRVDKTRVNVSASVGVQTRLDNTYDRLNTAEYVELMTEAAMNAGYTQEQAIAKAGRTDVDTNWPSLVYQTGIVQNYNISARGGSENVRFYSSIGFSQQEGVVMGNTLQKTSVRLNLDHDIGDKATISYSLSPTFTKKEYFSVLGDVNEILPNIPVYNEDGSYNTDVMYNPLAILNQNENSGTGNRTVGSVKLNYDVLDWLNLKTTYGIDNYSNIDKQYLSMLNQTGSNKNGQASRTNVNSFSWYWNGMASFKVEKNKHKFNSLVSLELKDSEVNTISAKASNFPNDFMRELSSGAIQETAGSRKTETSEVSYFGKVDYSYDSKYFLTGSFRNDASSIFGGDTKSSLKGALGGSWMMSREDWFVQLNNSVDMLKFRISAGTSGNSRIGAYSSRGVYTYSGADYNNNPGSKPLYGDNPSLSWETSFIFNVGTDFKINRYLGGSVEYYIKNNYDLLSKTDVSETTGFSTSTQNLGDSRNSGWEFNLNSTVMERQDFRWKINLMSSFEESVFTKLYHGDGRDLGTRIIREGESVRTLYLVRWAGVNPDNGEAQWYDINGDIVNYRSNSDRVIVGSSLPDFYGSLTNTLSYKGIELRMFTTFTSGNLVYNSNRAEFESDGADLDIKNQNKSQLDRWQKPGDITDVPKIVLDNESNSNYSSTRFLEDGSHINIKNISLAYTMKDSFANKLKVDNVRLSFAVDNVFIFSGFKSLSTANGKLSSYYPDMRTYQFSLSLAL